MPEPGLDDEHAATSAGTQPRFAWVPGSTGPAGEPLTGPVPDSALPGEASGGAAAGGLPQRLDYQALLEALAAGGFLDGRAEDQDAVLADELAAERDGRVGAPMPSGQVAALAVEHMDPGPAMAGWLEVATAAAPTLNENALAGVVIAAQKLASRAQAAGLAAVAQITARAAAADRRIGVAADGRPARVGRDAVGQVGLTLTLTDYGAAEWAELAVALSWRLRATGTALAAGRVDLERAQVIAAATAVLSDDAARAVEAAVLPEASWKTTAGLRKQLRRAVIAADPDAAERRRENAQRQARVCLYGDDDGTATLTGTGLPAVEAAAAMARITAIARAMKAAGQSGGLDLHRARVMIGLLLGTLPYIPPPDGTPEPPGDGGSGGPPHGDTGAGSPSDTDPGSPSDTVPGSPSSPGGPGPGGPGPGPGGPRASDPGFGCPADEPGDLPGDLPALRDEDAPPDDGLDDDADGDLNADGAEDDDDDLAGAGPAPAWPDLGAIPPALARPARPANGQPVADGRPVTGLLDVTLPWTTLAGLAGGPGMLGRIGPVTPAQARQLADAAENDPAAQWRVIVTNAAGQAIAVTRIRRRARRTRAGPGPPGQSLPRGAGLVGRATVVIRQDTIRSLPTGRSGWPGGLSEPGPSAGMCDSSPLGGMAAAALQAGTRALNQALAQAAADAAAGGCAHGEESPAYRPPTWMREQVTARDLTCRFPTCGQPAWRADHDHTIPYDQGGRTCICNLGGGCRKHHILKQDPRWKLEQTRPGEFTWTTPAGRTYTVGPDTYPV
jgi:hypothetical protein